MKESKIQVLKTHLNMVYSQSYGSSIQPLAMPSRTGLKLQWTNSLKHNLNEVPSTPSINYHEVLHGLGDWDSLDGGLFAELVVLLALLSDLAFNLKRVEIKIRADASGGGSEGRAVASNIDVQSFYPIGKLTTTNRYSRKTIMQRKSLRIDTKTHWKAGTA